MEASAHLVGNLGQEDGHVDICEVAPVEHEDGIDRLIAERPQVVRTG